MYTFNIILFIVCTYASHTVNTIMHILRINLLPPLDLCHVIDSNSKDDCLEQIGSNI